MVVNTVKWIQGFEAYQAAYLERGEDPGEAGAKKAFDYHRGWNAARMAMSFPVGLVG